MRSFLFDSNKTKLCWMYTSVILNILSLIYLYFIFSSIKEFDYFVFIDYLILRKCIKIIHLHCILMMYKYVNLYI